jgi:DNA invertase Pin-like site-specific DNA recombinase
MAKAYLYGRHSTDKQGMTREKQEHECRQYYDTHLKSKGIECAGFFYDDSVSGGTIFSEREKGRFVYFSLEKGDYLVVSATDRLFRNKLDGFRTLDQLDRKGVRRVILDLPDLSGLAGDEELYEMLEDQMVLYAHMYRRMASRRQRRDNAAKRDAGLPFSRSAPPGWRIVGTRQSKEYRVHVRERQMIDFMQTMSDTGMSADEIALWSMGQDTFNSEASPVRRFTTASRVRWALRARECGYPMITNLEEFMRAYRSGQVALCDS